MSTVTEEQVREAMGVMRWQARQCGRLPEGVTADDLESVGNEAIARCVATYDPASGIAFKTFVRTACRSAMATHVRREWERHRHERHFPADPETGEQLVPSADALTPVRLRDPVPRKARHKSIVVSRVEAESPEMAEVAQRVARQQLALYSAFTPEDCGAIMAMVTAKAKAGDLRAARLFLDVVRPRAGSKVQVAVIENPPDGMVPLGPDG